METSGWGTLTALMLVSAYYYEHDKAASMPMSAVAIFQFYSHTLFKIEHLVWLTITLLKMFNSSRVRSGRRTTPRPHGLKLPLQVVRMWEIQSHKQARESETNRSSLEYPRTHSAFNFFLVNNAFVLCDLPGYGFAKVPVKIKRAWGPMVETYLSERPQVRALLLLMDVRRTPGDWEMQLIQWASLHGYSLIPIVTKVDKLSVSKRKPAVAKVAKAIGVAPDQVIPWSSVSGQGLGLLWKTIHRFVQPSP